MPFKPKISILIVNYNSADFVNLSLFALKNLTFHSYQVFIIDNNSKSRDYKKLQKYCKKYDNVFTQRSTTNLTGSIAHGTALNTLIKKVDTPYFSILDADATWLRKGWDKILINKFTDRIKTVGTQAPEPKPQDFPLMFAIIFESRVFKKLHIDFRPSKSKPLQDTGWEIRDKYLSKKYTGLIINLQNTRFYKDGPFCDIPGVGEYYLNQKDSFIFASHFGRGSNPFGKQSLKFKNYLLNIALIPINFLLWFVAKRKWIKKCEELISNQE
jgi:glycosyltransferase involved in cell wall biosynthesis